MPDTCAGFPIAEFERRTEALQTGMATMGIEALLLTSAADIFYVTGFLTRFWESPARPWFVILPAAGRPVAVIPEIGQVLMQAAFVSEIRTWPAPVPQDDGVSLLTGTLADLVPGSGRIGMPMGHETHVRMPLEDLRTLEKGLAPRRLVDATDIVQRVREIKSDHEVARIRDICARAGAAFAEVPLWAAAGQPLDEVFRRFQIDLLAQGADWVSYVAGASGAEGYGDVISPADTRPLLRGDVLMLDTGAVRAGYFCDFDRNYSVGVPSDAVRRTHAALHAATQVALDAARPGMLAADLHGLLHDALMRQGALPGSGRFGHGLGVTLTEWPSLLPDDKTPLRPGMVLTLEPSAEVHPGRFLVHEENVVIRDTCAELLSPRAPADLPVLQT